jgi:hypothetical protein
MATSFLQAIIDSKRSTFMAAIVALVGIAIAAIIVDISRCDRSTQVPCQQLDG